MNDALHTDRTDDACVALVEWAIHMPAWNSNAVAIAAFCQPFDDHAQWRGHIDSMGLDWMVCTRARWMKERAALGWPTTERAESMPSKDKSPWNPSVKAVNRVQNALPAPDTCPHCGAGVHIAHHTAIYGGRSFGDWPWVYQCDECDARVGMHPFTPIPLGTLADADLRDERKRCKPAFERLHRHGQMTRGEAYAALAERLGIEREACHFGWFDADQCQAARAACLNIFTEQMEA